MASPLPTIVERSSYKQKLVIKTNLVLHEVLVQCGHLIKMKLKHGKSEKRVMKQVDLKGDATKQLHWRQPFSNR